VETIEGFDALMLRCFVAGTFLSEGARCWDQLYVKGHDHSMHVWRRDPTIRLRKLRS
jgi:hypothetical protein